MNVTSVDPEDAEVILQTPEATTVSGYIYYTADTLNYYMVGYTNINIGVADPNLISNC